MRLMREAGSGSRARRKSRYILNVMNKVKASACMAESQWHVVRAAKPYVALKVNGKLAWRVAMRKRRSNE